VEVDLSFAQWLYYGQELKQTLLDMGGEAVIGM